MSRLHLTPNSFAIEQLRNECTLFGTLRKVSQARGVQIPDSIQVLRCERRRIVTNLLFSRSGIETASLF